MIFISLSVNQIKTDSIICEVYFFHKWNMIYYFKCICKIYLGKYRSVLWYHHLILWYCHSTSLSCQTSLCSRFVGFMWCSCSYFVVCNQSTWTSVLFPLNDFWNRKRKLTWSKHAPSLLNIILVQAPRMFVISGV